MPGLIGTAGKPLASLSSTLLARKGQARPAMRPQGFGPATPSPASLDDLGWNDMGSEPPAPTPISAAVAPVVAAPPPPVLAERAALREEIAAAAEQVPESQPVAHEPAETEPEPVRAVRDVSVATAGRLQRETAGEGRAAFTLRLDAERHLKLRLASAVAHRSAQQLVSHALDQLLLTLPEVDALRAQLPATAKPTTRRPKRTSR